MARYPSKTPARRVAASAQQRAQRPALAVIDRLPDDLPISEFEIAIIASLLDAGGDVDSESVAKDLHDES